MKTLKCPCNFFSKKVKNLFFAGIAVKLIVLAVFAFLTVKQSIANPIDDGKTTKKELTYQLPEYPGGQEELVKFIAANLQYPDRAKEIGITGTVYIEFTVFEDGSLNDIKIAKSVFHDLDEEALRVMNSMPNWNPAKQGEQLMTTEMRLPIKFSLR
ncbi:MAG: hypothetical protein COA57_14760 [Flavobacteriales bacterium]|nr:MAG: hypothetical protein COA57_14760 [Flavobacteriales bacterium]